VFDFDQGNAIFGPFQVNSRVNSKQQRRPTVATTNNGDTMVAWLDDIGSGSSEVMPISAQIYSGDAIPLDIDFTASTQTMPETRGTIEFPSPTVPNQTDMNYANPDFLVDEAFAFQLAASDSDYALAWQTSDGIVVQRLTGGPFSCPQPSGGSCGNAVPLRVNGPAVQNIDIAFSTGVVKDENRITLTQFSTPYASSQEFARAVVGLVVNGYFANDVMRSNQASFNFYYDMDEGWISVDTSNPDFPRLSNALQALMISDDAAARALANVRIVVMKDLYLCEGGGPKSGQLAMNNSGETASMLPDRGAGLSAIYGDIDYNTLLHESGHGIFGLLDEYCPSDGASTLPNPNVFSSGQLCQENSSHPADCQACGVRGAWKADGNNGRKCCMAGQNGYWQRDPAAIQFDLDCQRRANDIIAQPWK
jgi:hypothetical protein